MSSAAFYQVFYQNETLFQLNAPSVEVAVRGDDKQDIEPAKPQVSSPTISAVPNPVIIEPKALPVQVKPPSFPSLNHKILILTDDSKNRTLIDSEAILLDNILKAVGHSSEKTDILNFSFLPGADARQVLSDKRTNFFITFGVPLIKLNLDLLLVPYAPKLVEGIWFLMADPLVAIDSDKALKKKLWLALQKIFEKV